MIINSRKTTLQHQIEEKTEEIKRQITTEIESEVETRFEAKQVQKAEEARLAAEAEAQAQAEKEAQDKLEGDEQQDNDQDQPTTEEPTPPEPTEEEKQKQLDEEKDDIRRELVDQHLEQNVDLQGLKDEMKNLDNEINKLRGDISDLDREISDIEQFLNFDFGPGAKLSYMNEQTYTFQTPEYTYTLKPFKDVTQGHTRVGSWNSWENDYNVMKYDKGERCWGGPDRSMSVDLVCGIDTKIVEVKEPNKCEYLMLLKTPGACKPETLEQLRNKLQQHK